MLWTSETIVARRFSPMMTPLVAASPSKWRASLRATIHSASRRESRETNQASAKAAATRQIERHGSGRAWRAMSAIEVGDGTTRTANDRQVSYTITDRVARPVASSANASLMSASEIRRATSGSRSRRPSAYQASSRGKSIAGFAEP